MRQPFPKNIDQKLKAQSLKLKAESYKQKALSYCVKCAKAFISFQLSALSLLLASFWTRIGLLWRRSVGVRFFMASSFLQSFQNYLKKVFNAQLAAFGFRLLTFSFFLLAFSFSTKAQNPPQIDTTIAATDSANVYYDDSTKIDNEIDTGKTDNKKIMAAIIFLSEASVKLLRQAKGFEYMAYLDSLLKARKDVNREPKQEQERPSMSFWNAGIIQLLCWMVAIGVVAFVLYKLFLGQGGAFSSNAKSNIPQVDFDEEPAMDDLDGQLKRATQSGNYRLATRYLFLKTLQQLSDKNAISLSTEKTNIQYSQELRGKPYADSFARLCLLYEYVWFGEFDINEEQFASIQQQQQQLAKAI